MIQEDVMADVEILIRDFLLNEFLSGEDPCLLTPDTPLITGGVLDSISTLKLVTFLEDRFGIRVEAFEASVDHLDTIHRIARFIAAKQGAAGG